MGFYAEYFKTFFKGPLATQLKQSVEIGRIENAGGNFEYLLKKEYPKLVEKEHRITLFLNKLKSGIKLIKKICRNTFYVIFNALIQEITELKEIDKINEALKGLPRNKQFSDIERVFFVKQKSILDSDENRERVEYREIEALINEAHKFRSDHEAFMNVLRTRIKEKARLRNIIERIMWRGSTRAVKRWIQLTKAIEPRLNTLIGKIKSEKNQDKLALSNELKRDLDAISTDISQMFYNSYLVKERAILMTIKIFFLAELADAYVKRMIDKHYIPKQQGEELLKELAEVIENIGQEIHDVLAQEFRIVVHELEKEEKKALQLAKAA